MIDQEKTNFILNKIREDIKSSPEEQTIITRFPPEPNGHLHIGHAKSICLNFGMTQIFEKSLCNLRFDDTNPTKEEQKYIDSIIEDINWLKFKWAPPIRYTSDYFGKLFEYAQTLIRTNKAYVCDLSFEQIRNYRGTLTQPGKNSPYRDRSIEENLKLFTDMKLGKCKEGSRVLRAKIDMESGNINMRDPIIYRIIFSSHHRTKNAWNIYPTYDFSHCISDAIEGITHSLCTLEFQDHRPLYNWIIETLKMSHRPQQIEFSRLNINYAVTSKRKLKELVDNKIVSGWEDPRLITIKGLRRRGYTPSAIQSFCTRIGVSKKETIIDFSILEECIRNDLNIKAQRRFAILNPIKLIIENYPENKTEWITVKNNPNDPSAGQRKIPFSKELWIDEEDIMLNPPKSYHRLSLNKEVRLRYAYTIFCKHITKDTNTGKIQSIICTYDPNTLGKKPEGRKVKGIIHWLEKKHAQKSSFNLYERLFSKEAPDAQDEHFTRFINPNSLQTKTGLIEKELILSKPEEHFQFERIGYFVKDRYCKKETPTFNLTTSLKDTWEKKTNT